jgi:hypothetical protein
LDWWRPLNALSLGLVGATFFSAYSQIFPYWPFVPVSISPPLV